MSKQIKNTSKPSVKIKSFTLLVKFEAFLGIAKQKSVPVSDQKILCIIYNTMSPDKFFQLFQIFILTLMKYFRPMTQ